MLNLPEGILSFHLNIAQNWPIYLPPFQTSLAASLAASSSRTAGAARVERLISPQKYDPSYGYLT
jgi:hypothetical protein